MTLDDHPPPRPASPPAPPVLTDEVRDETPPVAPAVAATPYSIVGIGASAGGLEAFEQFFSACPPDLGVAFVLVPHLDPGHQSQLTEILQRTTQMPVIEAQDQTTVAANHVYVIPPNRELAILRGELQLSIPEQARGHRMPIDAFLRSLAEDQAEKAIGIILSGTATDGTLGMRAILGAGGICIVQEPTTAKYSGMPQSAIAAGYATHIAAPEQMPALLRKINRYAAYWHESPPLKPGKGLSGINQVLLQLRSATGHDFSLYKKSTVGRRIERRMVQHQIADVAIYARFIKDNPTEIQALLKELLINVTSFFRDPESFDALKEALRPMLVAGKPPGYVFRVWVPGCASGEEAYSIAIVLLELLDEISARHDQELSFQIYATDLDDEAIATARGGCYPLNIAQDVQPTRLSRFFCKDENGYKINKVVRDMVVFAVHNVIKDPPFTRLDLLSCRNLMIYLEPELQNRLIPTFHYALKPDSLLLLSASESITNHPELFQLVDRKWKIFRARHTGVPTYPGTSSLMVPLANPGGKTAATSTVGRSNNINIAELSNRALVQSFAPASVTTDLDGNVLYVHGDTGKYLRPAPGPMNNNIIAMAREGMQAHLRAAILQTANSVEPTQSRELTLKTDDGMATVSFNVRRLSGQAVGEDLLLISFQEVAGARKPAPRAVRGKRAAATTPADLSRIEALKLELSFALEDKQATIEALQAANEELKSTNEELQSTNEELQSSNEELETSKEELQSLNEETVTVNSEMNARIEQLASIQNDMKNLFDNINIGTLFLDHHQIIRRFTKDAVKLYRLIPSDIGRPLSDITSNIEGDGLHAELQGVLDTLIPSEREVRTLDGTWYLARIKPYRTLDNVIEGVVLTFADITERRDAERLRLGVVQMARELAEGIIDTVTEPLIVLDAELQVVSASRSFYRHFKVKPEDTLNKKIYDLGDGQWDIPALRQLIEKTLTQNRIMEGFVVEHDFPTIGPHRMVLNARRIVTAIGKTELILLAMVAIEARTPS